MNKLVLLAPLVLVSSLAAPVHAGELPKSVDRLVQKTFEKLARAKGDRVFHSTGVAYHATITDSAGQTRDGIVRVSRGGANSKTHPDILGLAVKVKDTGGDQDFTLITSLGQRGLGARVPAFRNTFADHKMSSITSYKMGAERGPITTRLPATFVTEADSTPAASAGDQSFKLIMESPRTHVATTIEENVTVHFDRPLSAQESSTLKFTPFNTAGGVHPVGLLNALRKSAYLGSQAGRGVGPTPSMEKE